MSHHGFVAQGTNRGPSALSRGLRHLLPFQKTATFVVEVKIHDIAKVPLVNGDFQVGWKFRGGKGGSGISGVTNQSTKDVVKNPHNGEIERESPEATSPTAPSITSSLYNDDSFQLTPSPTDLQSKSSLLHPDSARRHQSAPTTTTTTSNSQDVGSVPGPRKKKLSGSSTFSRESTDTTLTTATTQSAPPAIGGGHGKIIKTLFNMPHLVESTTSINSSLSSLASSSQDESSNIDSESGGTISSALIGQLEQLDPSGKESTHSTAKRGLTPIHSLTDSNDCAWDFTVTQLVKINVHSSNSSSSQLHTQTHGMTLSSSRTNSSSSTVPTSSSINGKPHTQLTGWLGGGARSESGLKVVVYHIPTDSIDHENVQEGKPNGNSHHKHRSKARVYGFVNLDLAEYASEEAGMGNGGVTRRYLLKQGKTNATIKLTIHLQQVDGETNYVTPPLQKGHFLAGVSVPGDCSAVLESRVKPRSSPSSSSISTTGGSRGTSIGGLSAGPYASNKGSTTSLTSVQTNIQPRPLAPPDDHFLKTPDKKGGGHHRRDNFRHGRMQHQHHYHHHFLGHTPSVAPERVIEAIFNPYPSDVPGPFTRPRTPEELVRSRQQSEQEALLELTPEEKGTDATRPSKRTGHFPGHRIKSAFGSIIPESRSTHSRDLKMSEAEKVEKEPPPKPVDTVKHSRADGWPADTGKRGWGRKRSDTQDSKMSLGPIEQPRTSLDEETGMPM